MTFRLTKEFKFEASHQLPHHDGKCARLHGHSWKGRVVVEGKELVKEGAKQGMLIDYAQIKAILNPFVEEKLDHFHLNDSLGLKNPTSETIAKYIYDYLKPQIPLLVAVEIDETCTSSCVYRESD